MTNKAEPVVGDTGLILEYVRGWLRSFVLYILPPFCIVYHYNRYSQSNIINTIQTQNYRYPDPFATGKTGSAVDEGLDPGHRHW